MFNLFQNLKSKSTLSDCVPKNKLKQAPLPFMISKGILESEVED